MTLPARILRKRCAFIVLGADEKDSRQIKTYDNDWFPLLSDEDEDKEDEDKENLEEELDEKLENDNKEASDEEELDEEEDTEELEEISKENNNKFDLEINDDIKYYSGSELAEDQYYYTSDED